MSAFFHTGGPLRCSVAGRRLTPRWATPGRPEGAQPDAARVRLAQEPSTGATPARVSSVPANIGALTCSPSSSADSGTAKSGEVAERVAARAAPTCCTAKVNKYVDTPEQAPASTTMRQAGRPVPDWG